jgi:hypothetical protein
VRFSVHNIMKPRPTSAKSSIAFVPRSSSWKVDRLSIGVGMGPLIPWQKPPSKGARRILLPFELIIDRK